MTVIFIGLSEVNWYEPIQKETRRTYESDSVTTMCEALLLLIPYLHVVALQLPDHLKLNKLAIAKSEFKLELAGLIIFFLFL